jgi:hypothetical protein
MVDISTSDSELMEACPGLSVWMYRDIAQLRDLPQLPIALLYETEPGYGHWVGVLETPEGIEHFDSYGLKPDAELAWVPEKYRQAFHATAPHLVRLLARDGRDVNYNEYKLQSKEPKIATCGRWVVARCLNKRLTTTQFAEAMEDLAEAHGITPDEATLLIMPVAADI